MSTVSFVNCDFCALVFVEDMLDYVYGHNGLSRIPIIPDGARDNYRTHANFVFSSEIGEALLHIIRAFPNIAVTIMEYSNIFRLEEPIPGRHTANLLQFHTVSYMTDNDFYRDYKVWCSHLLHFLFTVCGLCIYNERRLDLFSNTAIIASASQVVCRIMSLKPTQKIDKFMQYAVSVLNNPLLSEIIVYDMD